MTFENKYARFMRNTGPARFFIPAGIILIVVGVLFLGFKTDGFIETSGKITSVTENIPDQDGQVNYDVEFTYTANGKEYAGSFYNMSKKYDSGDTIKLFYDPADPNRITNSKTGVILPIVLLAAGAAALVYGVYKTASGFRKSRELDDKTGKFPSEAFEGYKTAPDVTELYFRYDGNTLKPGYIIEDADRRALFEGKMLKNALVGARTFEFTDHTTGAVKTHEVGHTVTQSYNDELFSARSWFKFDGKNIWDLLHERGIRLSTNMHSKFPYVIYDAARNGVPFARIETCSMYVHEDEEAQHKIKIPTGRMYYRFWTNSSDLESLFLTIFAVSESEQAVAE